MNSLAIKTIRIYQYFSVNILRHLAPLFYSSCRFYPTCSEYAIESFNKYGFIKGLIKSIKRILKCNPLVKAGIDMP